MSFILDALRKAETERRRDQPQPIDELVSGQWELDNVSHHPGASNTLPWKSGVFVLLLLALALLSYFVFGRQSFDERDAPLPTAAQPLLSAHAEAAAGESRPPEPTPATVRRAVPEEARPASRREPAPDLDISGHVFIADRSPLNRVFIGANSYRQGDIVYGNWRIGQIRADSLLLVAEGQEVSLSLRH